MRSDKLRWRCTDTWNRIHQARVADGIYEVRPIFDTLYEARVKCYQVEWMPDRGDHERLGSREFDIRHFASTVAHRVPGERYFTEAKATAAAHYAERPVS